MSFPNGDRVYSRRKQLLDWVIDNGPNPGRLLTYDDMMEVLGLPDRRLLGNIARQVDNDLLHLYSRKLAVVRNVGYRIVEEHEKPGIGREYGRRAGRRMRSAVDTLLYVHEDELDEYQKANLEATREMALDAQRYLATKNRQMSKSNKAAERATG